MKNGHVIISTFISTVAVLLLIAMTPEMSLAQHEGHGGGATQPPPQEQKEPSGQETEEDDEAPTVEIEQDKQQLIGVRTAEAAVRHVLKTIRTVGRIEYDERRLATVNTKYEGWLEKLHIDYTGRYVKKGEPVAEIYSPELVATQQEYLNILAWGHREQGSNDMVSGMLAGDSERLIAAARQRLKLWDITDEQIRKIEETGTPIRTLTLYSPSNGYVVRKMAVQGMRVMPGEKIIDLADLSTVWVISDIYEYELALIKVGLPARISLSYFPGKQFSSVIDYIYPSLDAEARTAKVRFIITNPSEQLKPQMYTNVEIRIDMGQRLTVPDEAVIDTGLRKIIYVDKGEGYFEPREVLTGLRADGMTEITEGLQAGEKVASSGTFLIDSEAQLKGIKPVPRK